ncbi:MAG TPA: serine/threonine-protein kinase [Bryobacteraceae bacterium]|nr:serine/threonine-protein kinase [Bryobacteraceae bacterium]
MIAPASRKLGKYEIRQKLGRGGMADVYLATDSVLRQTVALKLIEHADDPDTRDSIDAERRGSILQAHLAALDHRVVQVFDSGDVDGFFYVAMEYVEGQDLSELMRHGALAMGFALEVAIGVAQTLENAHNLQVELGGKEFHGIVHGDIKPKNIRIDSHGQVRLLDFGIAKALSLSRRLTRNEFGSVPYGSPERLEAGEVNELSDLWSLAVMLYELVTGLQPYQAASTERLERMIRSRIPPPPAPDPCPKPLRRILVKAMSPEAADRYQSAREFREDLEAFRAGEPVQAMLETLDVTRRTVVPHNGSGPAVTVVEPEKTPEDETRRTTRDDETRRSGPDESTRRTEPMPAQAVADKPQANLVWGAKKAKPPSRVGSWLNQSLWGRRIAAGVVVITAISLVRAVVSDLVVLRRGAELERQIVSEQITDPNEIWGRWSELTAGNPPSWLLRGARKAVEQRLIAAADRVIAAYRSDTTVTPASWKDAQTELSRTLGLDPDNQVRGKLRLTEGYLALASSQKERKGDAVLADLNLAISKFTEAEQLLPRSPDPELGLARVYAYGLKEDVDRVSQALKKAEALGYPMGNREKAYLADGYRDRAMRTAAKAQDLRGLPQEKDLLERARDDYQQALEFYQAIVPYAKSGENIVKVQKLLDDVNSRLGEIDGGIPLPRFGNGDPLSSVHHNKIPPWLSTLLRNIWKSRNEKQ